MTLLSRTFAFLALMLTIFMVVFSGIRHCAAAQTVKVRHSVLHQSRPAENQAPVAARAAAQCTGIYWLVNREEATGNGPTVVTPRQTPLAAFFHPQHFFNSLFQPPR